MTTKCSRRLLMEIWWCFKDRTVSLLATLTWSKLGVSIVLESQWSLENPEVLSVSNASAPVNKMHIVAGRLWCTSHCEVYVINPADLHIEVNRQQITQVHFLRFPFARPHSKQTQTRNVGCTVSRHLVLGYGWLLKEVPQCCSFMLRLTSNWWKLASNRLWHRNSKVFYVLFTSVISGLSLYMSSRLAEYKQIEIFNVSDWFFGLISFHL